ncbi:hypothetical protein DFH07DRAFT_916583 [Mycena maculata]|uniref:Uncharacterized protein n=1 Tax=Mycena maculata TaxID=230809 RepID=A0AAD7NK24_9AGAR|nr:hypothetical protein DFH07DRAFT_916583 [Mycena maculata]
MPSSELSDALNFTVAHARPRNAAVPAPEYEYTTPAQDYATPAQEYATPAQEYATPAQEYSTPALQPAQSYVHRSELELAISEPPVPSRSRPNPSPGALNAVQELVALVQATKQAAELERTRRLGWEAELEAKYVQRQAEMERQMLDMRAELSHLRSLVTPNGTGHSPLFTSPAIANLGHPSPVSPVSQPAQQPQFVQGSSRGRSELHNALQPTHTITPSPSRHDSEGPSEAPRTQRKRRRADRSSDNEEQDQGSASDASSASSVPAQRRTNHHDKRLLTVGHAIRAHILLLMDLPTDKELPDSHPEGVPLDPPAPVRFVWDKTTKQSAHNGRMKLRVVDDFRSRRRLYKHVPEREFGKKIVDQAFEQAFTTFRQKFRTQRDALAASKHKQREDAKARKARHVARRKTKLSNRADARLKLRAFEHVTFDGAMQLECMSSEESDADADPETRSTGPLQTHGYGWRSRRLLRFYAALDVEDVVDASNKPKRGAGRRARFTGAHKEGFHLPPKGVASWMVSRRWVFAAQAEHPDLGEVLGGLVYDTPGFDWGRFGELGEETEDEERYGMQQQQPPRPMHDYTTSSLNSALA